MSPTRYSYVHRLYCWIQGPLGGGDLVNLRRIPFYKCTYSTQLF